MNCLNGGSCNVLQSGWDCCRTRGGRAQCPANKPIMCAGQSCSGDYCCDFNSGSTTCSRYNGVRPCSSGECKHREIVINIFHIYMCVCFAGLCLCLCLCLCLPLPLSFSLCVSLPFPNFLLRRVPAPTGRPTTVAATTRVPTVGPSANS